MLQTLLVPVDFTVHTARAVNYAIQIAQRSGATITILSADHRQPETDDNLLHLLQVADDLAHHHFTGIIQKIHPTETLTQIKARYHYIPSVETAAIVEEVKKHHFDLLVVSAKKRAIFSELSAGNFIRDFFRHLFFGNMLETLISTPLPCPLLIVPENCRYANINTIMYATNLEPNDYTMQKLQRFTNAIDAFINFVHVMTEETRSYNNRLAHFCTKADDLFGAANYAIAELNHHDVDAALSKYLQTNTQTNMVAMVERTNKARLDSWMLNSITRQMAYKAPVPVMILHDTADEL
ncbi:universal stress protein [Sphingobacteriales bacterium UPWRP_1]|nr:hypothetical protein B6N25_00350 [Sphingobacteriales bacterium TSM_CSS]PSJ71793.1 universal stress protein [Sphingobacteriales bacterium UPWRP_1]